MPLTCKLQHSPVHSACANPQPLDPPLLIFVPVRRADWPHPAQRWRMPGAARTPGAPRPWPAAEPAPPVPPPAPTPLPPGVAAQPDVKLKEWTLQRRPVASSGATASFAAACIPIALIPLLPAFPCEHIIDSWCTPNDILTGLVTSMTGLRDKQKTALQQPTNDMTLFTGCVSPFPQRRRWRCRAP